MTKLPHKSDAFRDEKINRKYKTSSNLCIQLANHINFKFFSIEELL